MRIESIYAENFQGYSTLSLAGLSKYNTFLLLGDNGAGKSSILEIILYNIFGISMRENKSDLVNINTDTMVTKCTYLVEEGKVVIERGMNKGSTSLNVMVDGKDVTLRKIEDTENLILSKYIPITANLFKKSHLFRANVLETETDKTSKLSIADLIEELFNVNELDEYKKISTQYRLKLDHSFKKGIVNVNQYISQINKLKRIKEDAEEELTGIIDEKQSVIDEQRKEMEELNIKLKKYEPKLPLLTEEVTTLDEKARKYSNKKHSLMGEIESYKKQYGENKKIFDLDICPYCKQPITQEKKQELAEKMKEVKDGVSEIKESIALLTEKENNIRNELNDKKDKQNKIKEGLDKIKNRLYVLKSNVSNLEQDIKSLSNKTSQTGKVDAEIKIIRKKLKRVIGAMTHNSYHYSIADDLVKILSEGSDFRYFFINLDGFNEITQKYVKFFNLKFDVRLEVNEKSKIVPIITPHYSTESILKFAQLSQGQKRKTVLVLLMSIISFLLTDNKHLRILFFDEVLDSLDTEGVDSVIQYVNMLKDNKEIQSFFISHSHLSKIVDGDFFDKIFWVNQNDAGVSQIQEFDFNAIAEEDINEILYKSDDFAKSGIAKKELKNMLKEEKFRLILNYELLRELMN